jgi:heme/copper-type cytochrome/quinol oxidase subunit 4
VERERGRERQSASRKQRRRSEGQANAREKESKKDRTPQGWREREKKNACNQTDDYLMLYRWSSFGCSLVMVTTFSSLLPLSRCISLSLSFALHATSGLSSHTALPILLYYYPIFFSLFFFFPVKKTNNGGTQCNNNLFSFIIIINIIIRILRAYGTSI